jgi:PKD repeat protein
MPTRFLDTFRCRFTPIVCLSILSGSVGTRLIAQPVSNIDLPAPAQGSAAIAALGAHLPEVAKAYGLRAQDLASLLQLQPSLGVDVKGALQYICASPGVTGAPKGSSTGQVQEGLTATSSVSVLATGGAVDAFQLHSLPGASRVIYLDFNGHVTRGTSWNSRTGGADIVSAPFDLDGDPATFSASERAVIESIWKRVAEDYAPFLVNVTTQDPGVDALQKTASNDNVHGIRVVISPTNWYSTSAGGVAYVGSFSWNTDTPCYVFTNELANHDKYIAEVASHEAGHTVGLFHDGLGGSAPTEYYYGQGNWAPIMGAGFYASFTQFSKGEYNNANNTQDDFAVIAGYLPIAADDHGGTLAAASVLVGPSITTGGTIETRTDVDVFRFDTGAGTVVLNIASPAPEANLHLQAELLNASGQVLLVSDLATWSASFSPTLAAGTYYLRIAGIGSGDPKTTGYSDYGSTGNYLVTGSLIPIVGQQAPVAQAGSSTTNGTAALRVEFRGDGSRDPDGSIVSYLWDFGTGETSTAVNPAYTYTLPGSYLAVLTVRDNVGLASSASVFITVTAPANAAPVAVASANVVSGVAPLVVSFSSAGSTDPDGSIASYSWNFGDGATSTSAAPAKTYTVPGSYTATLTVTDNLGATGTASVVINVARDPNNDVDVSEFSLSKVTAKNGVGARATVVVRDRLGRAVSGATVSIQWSGVVSGTTSAKTDSSGTAMVDSAKTKKVGTITGTLAAVVPANGGIYDAGLFTLPTSLSLSTK